MAQQDLSFYYDSEIQKIMAQSGLNQDYIAEVRVCSNMSQVFEVVAQPEAQHIAVLSKESSPIQDSFLHIKDSLAKGKTVAMALFYSKEPGLLSH